jgi:hypothetical protein
MNDQDTLSNESPPGTNSPNHQFAPCSCCMALAQVRMVGMPVTGQPGLVDGSTGHDHSGSNGNGNGNNSRAKTRKGISFGLPGIYASKKEGGDAAPRRTESGNKPIDVAQDSENGAKAGPTDGPAEPSAEDAAKAATDEWHDDLGIPKERSLWQGFDGKAVMIFGVLLPVLLTTVCCASAPKRITLLLLNHPLETSVELFLISAIPITILFIWSSLCKNNISYTLGRGIALGASVGSALVVAGVCLAALFNGSTELQDFIGTDFSTGFCWLAFMALGAAFVGLFLANRMRLARHFDAARVQVVAYTFFGVLLSVLGFIGAESRPWQIRLAQVKAVSTEAKERNEGLRELRALAPERELRMECSDQRAAGLAGLFMPLKPSSELELYFAVTGKPFSFREENTKDISYMPDDDFRRRIVGEPVKGLSLIRSTLDGAVHPHTLSSTLNWTFVFKNDTSQAQEVRSEIMVPPGAVVTGLTLWRQGEPQPATIAAAGKAEGFAESNWTQVGHDGPAIISDLGRGRMLMHCFPVSPAEELKVAVKLVVPLKPDGSKAATLSLPSILASNFKTKGFSHLLKLRSPLKLASVQGNFKNGSSGTALETLEGAFTDEQLQASNINIKVARNEMTKPIVVLDKVAVALAQQDEKRRAEQARLARESNAAQAERQIIVMIDGSKGVNGQLADINKALDGKPAGRVNHKQIIKTIPPHYIVQNVTRVAAPAPHHLVVVVDGSAAVKQYAEQITQALTTLPSGIPTDVIVASQEHDKFSKAMPLAQALAELKKVDFVGGQNNLQSVINASELAGDRKGGAVLWIHGPQPNLNEEIYIMSQYTASPTFYELPVGSGDTDTFDFFKNHSEIGPFSQVPRNTNSLSADLAAFFSKWKPNSNDYAVTICQTTQLPKCGTTVSDQEAQELVALGAKSQCDGFISSKHIRKAARVAVAYGVVSPVSCALVTNSAANTEDNADDSIEPADDKAQTQLGAGFSSGGGTGGSGSNSPIQGATNGTIAPAGADATYVMGVNTAGTVRVNNLANLEAMLNIIANLGEIGCAIAGLVIAIHGFVRRGRWSTDMMGHEMQFSSGQRIAFGVCLILAGLAMPGLINWFVASARDAALFN